MVDVAGWGGGGGGRGGPRLGNLAASSGGVYAHQSLLHSLGTLVRWRSIHRPVGSGHSGRGSGAT